MGVAYYDTENKNHADLSLKSIKDISPKPPKIDTTTINFKSNSIYILYAKWK